MKLSSLVAQLGISLLPEDDREITGLTHDSRQVQPGDLFLAYPGALSDGRDYIQDAIAAGAKAVLYEPENAPCKTAHDEVPMLALPQLNQQLALLASRYYQNPSESLSLIGVTGTNGKTTIAYQLAQAYALLGKKTAYIGTLGYGDVFALKTLVNTTPDALTLQHIVRESVTSGVDYLCMEVSSHALSLGRVEHLAFQQGIYTNLSLDHLDFHLTMDAYASAKARLFATKSLKTAIINVDDAYASCMQSQVHEGCDIILYGMGEQAHVRALSWSFGLSGSRVEVSSPWGQHTLQLQSLGRFNIYNSLAVFASLMASEVAGFDDVVAIMSQLKPSPGRMEIVAQHPCVIVDYAHTPDALENVLVTLRELKPARLWVVFGCGGDRDRSKRPVMGEIASQHADIVILTNDNPRTENPDSILKAIRDAIPSRYPVHLIPDRRDAIHYALAHASPDDVVLIAGKGHENYQIIGHQKSAFSDQAVVKAFVASIS